MSAPSAASSSRNVCPRRRLGVRVWRPADSASRATGVGRGRLPRPPGSAGRVTTPATTWALARTASSTATANSGLPQKTTRMSDPRLVGDPDPLLRHRAAPLAHHQPALQRAQVVDEEDAVQVIDLVLEGARQELR